MRALLVPNINGTVQAWQSRYDPNALRTGSGLCFGLGHVYQGLKGAVNTTIAEFGFGLLFLLSGNLIPCILLHALMDLQMVYVLRPIPGGAADIATEMA